MLIEWVCGFGWGKRNRDSTAPSVIIRVKPMKPVRQPLPRRRSYRSMAPSPEPLYYQEGRISLKLDLTPDEGYSLCSIADSVI